MPQGSILASFKVSIREKWRPILEGSGGLLPCHGPRHALHGGWLSLEQTPAGLLTTWLPGILKGKPKRGWKVPRSQRMLRSNSSFQPKRQLPFSTCSVPTRQWMQLSTRHIGKTRVQIAALATPWWYHLGSPSKGYASVSSYVIRRQ